MAPSFSLRRSASVVLSGGERLRRGWRAWLAIGACVTCVGCCSGPKVAQQTERPRDLNVLAPGTPRTRVIAELGRPLWTEERGTAVTDVFVFKQGPSKTAKAARTVADVVTLGTWETPAGIIDSLSDGNEVQLEVRYDENHLVESREVFRGADVVPESSDISGKPAYPALAANQPAPAKQPVSANQRVSPGQPGPARQPVFANQPSPANNPGFVNQVMPAGQPMPDSQPMPGGQPMQANQPAPFYPVQR